MITWQDVINRERDCRELSNEDSEAEETEQQARERMTEAERRRDDAYREQLCCRQGPARTQGKRKYWGKWRKRAGVIARKQRAGR